MASYSLSSQKTVIIRKTQPKKWQARKERRNEKAHAPEAE